MKKYVNMGEFYISDNEEDIIYTCGVGSCIVICLFDVENKYRALFHAMLPNFGNVKKITNMLKYVDSGLDIVFSSLYKKKCFDLNAKIIGGAKLFKSDKENIGYENIVSVKKKLRYENVKIVSEDTGGDFSRDVYFYASNLKVKIKTVYNGEYFI
jgi:chemotaxis protein CheD